jgi:mono/diheme cytochrome c family protein
LRLRQHFIAAGVVSLVLVVTAAGQTPATEASAPPDPNRALLKSYCVTCHNARAKTGGLALDGLELKAAAGDAKTWEKVLRKLRGNLMPPPGAKQPARKDVDTFVAFLETKLDGEAKGPQAGHVPVQRLNRTEYAAAVKALVGVDVNAKDVLPQDIEVEGFDNIAAALTVSPSFLDQYVSSARHIAKLAVGNPNPRVSATKYLITANQNPDIPPPPGSRGAVKFTHNFPADGQYRVTFNDLSVGLYTNTMENESTVVMMVDGKPVFHEKIGGEADLAIADRKGADGRAKIMERFTKIPVQVPAGVHEITVAFIDRSNVESDEIVAGGGFGGGSAGGRMARLVDGIEVAGPFDATGVSRTASRALIFVCDPKKTGDAICAKQITETLARRAFRRPVTPSEVARLMPFYEAGRKAGSFDQGVEQVVAAVLGSPEFLYRSINGARALASTTAAKAADADVPLSNLELASRLSFFLWNTQPDEALLKLASMGQLTKPGVLDAQVRRMLVDPKASSLVTSFAMKWLNLDDLDAVKPDPALFRGFNEQLRHDFEREAQDFITSVLLEDRSVADLLTADYTFLNERLARHYGIPGVLGNQFRRVALTDKARFGLLGKAAVLMRTSYADRTSPVLRGAWVLDKLLGTPPTPPPPNVETNLTQAAGEKPKTVRARLEEHRNKATCNQCHGVIDPTGLALENFDAIGQYRTRDREANLPIDAATVLPSGVAINGPVDLRMQLSAQPEVFARTMTERLTMYAVNRELEYFDMPQIRAVVRHAAKDDYKFSSIILGIVNTDSFRKQRPEAAAERGGEKMAAAR